MNANQLKVGGEPINGVLHEQLALKRLKLLQGSPPRAFSRAQLWLGRAWRLAALLLGALRREELLREVGPGKRPELLYEWDRLENLNVR